MLEQQNNFYILSLINKTKLISTYLLVMILKFISNL